MSLLLFEDAAQLFSNIERMDVLSRQIEDIKNHNAWLRQNTNWIDFAKQREHARGLKAIEAAENEIIQLREQAETCLGLRPKTLGIPSQTPLVLLDNKHFWKLVECTVVARAQEKVSEEMYKRRFSVQLQGQEQLPGQHIPLECGNALVELNQQFQQCSFEFTNEQAFRELEQKVQESPEFVALAGEVAAGRRTLDELNSYWKDTLGPLQEDYRKRFNNERLPAIQERFVSANLPLLEDILTRSVNIPGNPSATPGRNLLEKDAPEIFAWVQKNKKIEEADRKLEVIAAFKEMWERESQVDPERQELLRLAVTSNSEITEDVAAYLLQTE